MLKLRRILFFLLALALAPAPVRAQSAQAEPIAWDIVPGWDGRFRGGAWFPLDITLANNGPDVRATLRFQIDGAGQPSYALPIDLPHNGRKRVLLPIQSGLNNSGAMRGTLSLNNGTQEIKRERVLLNSLDSFGLFVGIVADEGDPLPELSNLQGRGQSATLLRLRGADFPEQAELLQSFDVLFVADAETEDWTDAQRAALAAWLNQGNTLVVGGAPGVLRGLDGLLPAGWQESGAVSSVAALSEGSGFGARPDAQPLPVLSLEPRPGSETLRTGDGGLPLVVRGRYGLGTVLQAAFGLEQLNEAGNAAQFWQTLVTPLGDRQPAWLELRQRAFGAVQNALRLPELSLPSILGFIGFLLLYILVVGPLNYLLLRRLDRREWAYFTIPLVVLAFSGVAYVWGNLGRGSDAQVNQLSIVRVEPGGERARATSYVTVYSPVRQRYNVGVAGDTLVGDLDPWDGGGLRLDVRYEESSVALPDLLIDVGGVRGFTAEHEVAAPPVEVERAPDGSVRLRNAGDAPIEDAALVRGDGMAQSIGRLDPGTEQTVRFAPVDFVQNVGAASGGSFDRQSVINGIADVLVLAGPGGFIPPGPDGVVIAPGADPAERSRNDEIFLLGWQPRATAEVMVNGSAASVGGDSLFVWPVSGEGP